MGFAYIKIGSELQLHSIALHDPSSAPPGCKACSFRAKAAPFNSPLDGFYRHRLITMTDISKNLILPATHLGKTLRLIVTYNISIYSLSNVLLDFGVAQS